MEKEYLLRFRPPTDGMADKLAKLQKGIHDENEFLEVIEVKQINENQLKFVLSAGKHHHIRRMCDAVNLHVLALKRVRIGNVVLGDLPVGKWRYLRPDESFA
jgi:23S rRNA pseudouridine2604 synthase